MKFSINDLDAAQLATCMAALGVGGASAAAPGKPAPPPPAAKASPPAPPPKPAAPVASGLEAKEAEATAAMRTYAGKYGAEHIPGVFTSGGMDTPTIKGKTAEELDWLIAAFSV